MPEGYSLDYPYSKVEAGRRGNHPFGLVGDERNVPRIPAVNARRSCDTCSERTERRAGWYTDKGRRDEIPGTNEMQQTAQKSREEG